MDNRDTLRPNRCVSSGPRLGRIPLVLLLAALVVAVGCGGKGTAKNSVSGKVTLSGDPVTGTIVFVGSDGKTVEAPISPDGTYTVDNPPIGSIKIAVKGLSGPGGMAPPTPSGAKDTDKLMGADKGKAASKMGGTPPAKYAVAESSGLTFTVTSGKQKHDIPLEP